MASSQAQILKFCLQHCRFDGWTVKLLENACLQAKLDRNHWKIEFPSGAVDVIDYFFADVDEKTAKLKPQGKTPEKIRAVIKSRLENNNQYKEQIRAMLGVYLLHPLNAAKAGYRAIDAIWRAAGDKSVDWNFYSKRMLLAGVYGSTLLFWLNDKSKNNSASWEFLDKRLAEVGQLNKGMSKIKSFIPPLTADA